MKKIQSDQTLLDALDNGARIVIRKSKLSYLIQNSNFVSFCVIDLGDGNFELSVTHNGKLTQIAY